MSESKDNSAVSELANTIRKWLESYDLRQREDHDTITRLEGKVDTLTTGVQGMNDGLAQKVSKLEDRATKNDRLIDQIKPLEVVEMVKRHDEYIHDQIHANKLIKGAINILWMILGTAVTLVIEWIRTSH